MTTQPSGHSIVTETLYLGFRLKHPFIAGASPLSAHLDGVRRLEDAGAAAIVLPSLFEEQITREVSGRIHGVDPLADPMFAPLVAMFPSPGEYPHQPDEYLEHVRRAKSAVDVPVIASLNGTSRGAWMRHALLLQQAGADALEVNFYNVLTDANISAATVENDILSAVQDLKRSLTIPIALKLSPFFTAFVNLAGRLDKAGVDGLVLFNRFYQPDIDIASLTAAPRLELSRSSELRLRLRWLAILHGRLRASLAATGGVETWSDGVKAILAGAHAVQVVSALLRNGPGHLTSMVHELVAWMDRRQFVAFDQMRGLVSLETSADPEHFERAAYIHALHTWGAGHKSS
jgi:dihydroorotate dehydrogenase (fumarate)